MQAFILSSLPILTLALNTAYTFANDVLFVSPAGLCLHFVLMRIAVYMLRALLQRGKNDLDCRFLLPEEKALRSLFSPQQCAHHCANAVGIFKKL